MRRISIVKLEVQAEVQVLHFRLLFISSDINYSLTHRISYAIVGDGSPVPLVNLCEFAGTDAKL